MGGLVSVLATAMQLFMYQYGNFIYKMKAISKFYMTKADDNFYPKKKSDMANKVEKQLDAYKTKGEIQEEVKNV